MKIIILSALVFLLLTIQAFAHGGPTIDEFQTFRGSFTQNFANITGGTVAVPCGITGGVLGLIIGACTFGDIKESGTGGLMFGALVGYIAGQQLCWPIYGIEYGLKWVF